METPHGRLLVVEDDPEMRDLLQKFLAKEGYRVAVACDGREALRLLALRSVDLVITDLRMPCDGGLHLLQAVQAAFPGLPVIVVTAFGDWDSYLRAMELGATAFISKPLRMVELSAAVQTALTARGAAASP